MAMEAGRLQATRRPLRSTAGRRGGTRRARLVKLRGDRSTRSGGRRLRQRRAGGSGQAGKRPCGRPLRKHQPAERENQDGGNFNSQREKNPSETKGGEEEETASDGSKDEIKHSTHICPHHACLFPLMQNARMLLCSCIINQRFLF